MMFYWIFKLTSTLYTIELHFIPSNLHLNLDDIYFVNVLTHIFLLPY